MSCGDILATNKSQLLWTFLSGLFCFLPLILGVTSLLESSPLRNSLEYCPGFRYSCAASVSLVGPLFCDALFDVMDLSRGLTRDEYKIKTEGEGARFTFLNISERLLILMGIVILPLVGFLPLNTDNLGLIFICCSKIQLNWVGGAIGISLCRYDKEYWSTKCTVFSLISFSIGLISAPFLDNIYAGSKNPPRELILMDNLAFACVLLPCLLFLFNCSRWLIIVYCKAYSWKRILMCASIPQLTLADTRSSTANTDHTFFPMVYTLSGFALVGLLCLLIGLTPRSDGYNQQDLLRSSLPFLIFLMLISTLSMRIVKSEVVLGLYALIDSKKSYVRYISHELRTPLNSAFLGLKLLTDDFENSEAVEDIDRSDILGDISVACRTTVDILNDLLCFDKMESGILVLHKHESPVLSFINDCVGMFSAQAREGDVTMTVATGDGGSTDDIELFREFSPDRVINLPLLESDTIIMDRFKMDQVLRNLISNALKFTPRGGSVTVTASFVPTATPPVMCLPQTPQDSFRCDTTTSEREHNDSSRRSNFHLMGLMGLRGKNFTRTPLFQRKSSRVHICSDVLENEETSSFDQDNIICTEGSLIILVKDTGAGMIEENYKRLFLEIVQFNPEVLQAGGGSGLGLWITKGIVDLHKGKISVFSEGEGRGSIFTVELPMIRKQTHRKLFTFQEENSQRR